MKCRIYLHQKLYRIVEASPRLFDGWVRLPGNIIEANCNNMTEEQCIQLYAIPQIQDFFHSLKLARIEFSKDDIGEICGKIIMPSGLEMPIFS